MDLAVNDVSFIDFKMFYENAKLNKQTIGGIGIGAIPPKPVIKQVN
jgi:hypothetical protein